MKVDASRLSLLFEGVSFAADAGRHREAARLADAARRYAPDHPTARLIHARSLLQHGEPAAAAKFLESADDSESRLVYAEAALDAGLIDAAIAACHRLLHEHAVDSLPALAGLAGRLCREHPALFPGWMGIDGGCRLIGELVTAHGAAISWGNAKVGRIGDGSGPTSFAVPLPDGASGPIHVFAGNRELLGSGLEWPADFGVTGWVVLEGRQLVGEVSMAWHANALLTVLVAPGPSETRHPVEPQASQHIGRPFACTLDDSALDHAWLEVVVELPDGRRQPLLGSPLKQPPVLPQPITPMPHWMARGARLRDPKRLVNVVVPVYAAREETLTCLRSVLATLPPRLATLTVVDDASPDPELRAELEAMAATRRITLLRNPVNLGYPGAANRGIRLHPERDVVLLNSDTEVFPGWLERLHAAAHREDGIATVTPFGESAAIVSYGDQRGTLTSITAAVVDRVAAAVNADHAVDIPVGVGFCLYIRRRALGEIGEFDEHAFGRGYGEETDFCLRARRRGWRHVAATNVFVRHLGGRSFGRAKAALSVRNQRVINHRHPGYDQLINGFIAEDPLRLPKRDIDEQRLLEAATQPVLLVTLALGGGVKRVVEERRRALEESGSTVLVLRGATPNTLEAQSQLRIEAANLSHLVYDQATELGELSSLLSTAALTAIEIHHFLGLTGAVLEMLLSLGVPYRVVVHDYTWVCPRVSFLNGAGVYCGEPEVSTCESCVRDHGSALRESLTVAALRERSAFILRGAERVVVPTEDVRSRLARYFPDLSTDVDPWEPPVVPRPRARARREGPVRVLLLGALNTQKGAAVLLACAEDAAARDLPLEFIVIGYSSQEPRLLDSDRLFMTGPYEEHEVPALLEREDCDVALFPTVGPETWCFTLTHALAHGMPIVAFDLGAVAERLRAANSGVLLPWTSTAVAVNDELLRVAAERAWVEETRADTMEDNLNFEASNLNDTAASEEPSATVQVVNLPPGLYAFSVESGAGVATGGLMLPALGVAPAPVRDMGRVEFMSGPSTMDRWLTAVGDAVTVKISGGDAALLLTSVRAANGNVLSIDVKRLDGPPADAAPAPPTLPAATTPASTSDTRVITLVHVPYLGDLTFVEGWAGKPAENLWIEGFSVVVEEPALPELVEYCGVSEEGDVSGWMSGGDLCGARGTGVPLVAFAVRIKPDAEARYTCQYSGRFLSGNVIGPFEDGRFCRSEAPGDPLVAMELRIEPDRHGNAGLRA